MTPVRSRYVAHVSVQLAPGNRGGQGPAGVGEVCGEGSGVGGRLPSARSLTVASRFSSGRDGLALGEE